MPNDAGLAWHAVERAVDEATVGASARRAEPRHPRGPGSRRMLDDSCADSSVGFWDLGPRAFTRASNSLVADAIRDRID